MDKDDCQRQSFLLTFRPTPYDVPISRYCAIVNPLKLCLALVLVVCMVRCHGLSVCVLQVNQFVQAYLGDTDDAKKFVKQFVEKQGRIQHEVAAGFNRFLFL